MNATEPTTTTRQLWQLATPKRVRPFAVGVSKRGEPFSVYEYVGGVLIRAKMQGQRKVVMPHEKQ